MATFPNSVTLAGHRGGFEVTIFAAPARLAVKEQIDPATPAAAGSYWSRQLAEAGDR
jgi:hypothetical protein